MVGGAGLLRLDLVDCLVLRKKKVKKHWSRDQWELYLQIITFVLSVSNNYHTNLFGGVFIQANVLSTRMANIIGAN